ncbi:MAG: hypothetical protein WBB34_02415 [Xanthobacteraceae bacterium]
MRNALVPVAPSNREVATSLAARAANADFIAHLIATAAQDPQTRARRRATADEAIAAYEAVGQWPTRLGRKIRRSL